MSRHRLALCIALLLAGWAAVASYVLLAGPTRQERETCKESYERGAVCLIVRVVKP